MDLNLDYYRHNKFDYDKEAYDHISNHQYRKDINPVILNNIIETTLKNNASNGVRVNSLILNNPNYHHNDSYYGNNNNKNYINGATYNSKLNNLKNSYLFNKYLIPEAPQKNTTNIEKSLSNLDSNENIVQSSNTSSELRLNQINLNENSSIGIKNNSNLNITNSNTINNNSSNENKFKFKLPKISIKDMIPCLIAWFILISFTAVYYVLVFPRLIFIIENGSNYKYWIILLVVKIYLFVNIVINYLISMFRDPGRFPKNTSKDENFLYDLHNQSSYDVYMKEDSAEVKWCKVSFFNRLIKRLYLIIFN
jgi:hypothetical protein